ncbi:MAG: M56 family metallopeptidase [Blautia sp.]|nr:M56 family metallopeptidase [Blautia sp.]MCM1200342.1 M56 family metallopeptidase [Bacteroides fragilis]
MSRIFLTILNMSLTASYCIAAVILLRFFLKRQPKIFSYLLWGVVLFRLLCPFSFSSSYSLLRLNTNLLSENILHGWDTDAGGGEREENAPVQGTENAEEALGSQDAGMENTPGAWARKVISVGAWIWSAGVIVLFCYSVWAAFRLRRSLEGAVKIAENQYETEGIATPFVMGLCRPRIYLPARLQEKEKRYVLAHEELHIARKDYLVKLVFYAAACLHWFNPLVWPAFVLMENDMEMSCDEAVLKKLGADVKKEYSMSLLSLSAGEGRWGSSPPAFGEGRVKGRVRNILAYRKRAALTVVLGAVVIIAAGAGLLLNPVRREEADEEAQKLAAFVEAYAEAFSSRTGEEVVALYMDGETALENVPMLEKVNGGYALGMSSPWPDGFRYQIYPEENRADIYYYAWTSDPHITVWLEKMQCIMIDGEYRVAEDFYRTFDNIISKEEFDSAYRIQDTWQFIDYKESGFVDAINYQREDGTSSVDNTVYEEPVKAAEYILNLKGGTGAVDGGSSYQAMVRYTFEDGSEALIPMYQANYDAETGTSAGGPVWIVDTAVWNAGAP